MWQYGPSTQRVPGIAGCFWGGNRPRSRLESEGEVLTIEADED